MDFGFLVILPLLSLLLLLIKIGNIIAFILILAYIISLLIAKPIFIIAISKLISNKININSYVVILILNTLISLIGLIPYAGIILSLLIILMGLGIIFVNKS